MAEVSSKSVARAVSAKATREAVGLAAVGWFQRGFDAQHWDGNAWPKRYPFQRAPKLNVAGALARFNLGLQPLKRHYEDSPVLKGTGALAKSFQYRIGSRDIVHVGVDPTVAHYASIQNFGGESVQPVTPIAKKRIKSFIRRKPEYAKHLSPLLDMTEKVTDVIARKFIGVTHQLEGHLAGVLADAIEKEGKRLDRLA